ncbi:DUF1917-domain-containing protein [Tothia fuscella]|uniref:DUF1917-domain-containing protein n=1 Tax=Tothia fuscella TaxID=1048955 RepID=A0A9P4P3T9_9PEZI|nr:DUF1917-domain-containing protein [Tothia fuscella]
MGGSFDTTDLISDDSSFYGDQDTQREWEHNVDTLDIKLYWADHSKSINVIAAKAAAEINTTKTEHDTPKIDEKFEKKATPLLPKREPFNPMEGQESAKQLGESVDDFLRRLPVIGSAHIGHWLWVANPYAERDAVPESRDTRFLDGAARLMQEYLVLKKSLAASEPNLAAATITRRLKPDREKLKEEILESAKSNGLTSGKWMLFPSEANAPAIWRQVVTAITNNKLGTAAKIATEGETRLICCYTKDFSDVDDIRRVVQAMADIGLISRDSPRGIYYKCDVFTHLDIGSGNEYGIPASLYGSKEIWKTVSSPPDYSFKSPLKQKRLSEAFSKGKEPARKRR